MNDCIFCKIIDGSIPSKKVYEDENGKCQICNTNASMKSVRVVRLSS